MSPVQYGMVVESLKRPGQGVYVLQKRVGLRHRVDVEQLERALALVVACHPTLRTRFLLDDPAGPSQLASPEVDAALAMSDFSRLGPEAQRRAAADYLADDLARGFSLADASPPIRAALLRYGEQAHDFIWTSHHALLDGRSWAIVLAQLFDAYDALCAGRRPALPTPPPYSSYVRWRETRDRAQEQSFWSAQLAGAKLPSVLGVAGPTVPLGPGERTFAVVRGHLDEQRSRQLYALAQPLGVNAQNWVQAGWSVLLHQASGCEDVVFGTTRACRSFAPDARERIGVFLNTLPLRVSVRPAMTVGELVQSVRRCDRALRKYEHSAAGEIRRWARVPARTALFGSAVVFERHQYRAYFQARGGAWEQRDVSFGGYTPFPFALNAYRDRELALQLNYDRRVCTEDAAAAVCGHMQKLLDAMARDPNAPVATLPQLPCAALAERVTGAKERRERDFWRGRLSSVEATDSQLLEGPASDERQQPRERAGSELVVQEPLIPIAAGGGGPREGWERAVRCVAGATAFFARLAGDDGGCIGLRRVTEDDPSSQRNFRSMALPACVAPRALCDLQEAVEKHLAADGPFVESTSLAGTGGPLVESTSLAGAGGPLAESMSLAGAGGPLVESTSLAGADVPAIALELVADLDTAPARSAGTVMLLQFPEYGDVWRCVADADVLSVQRARAICAHLSALLAAIPGDRRADLMALPLLTAAQQRRVLEEWNATAAAYPARCVHQLVAAQAARRPDAVAVSGETETLTYRELAQRSAALAAELAARGIGRGSTVGVCLERSAAMVVALLGVLGSGAAFVPLDPGYPQRRITQMSQASHLELTLTDGAAEANVRDTGVPLLRLDRDWSASGDRDGGAGANATAQDIAADDIAYVIYTSGSTGRPKGVRVRHGALTNLLCAMADRPGFTATDELLALTTVCFDIAYLELFLPLISGGRVAVCPAHVSSNGVLLRKRIERTQPTVIQATPSTWKMLIAAHWQGDPGLKVLCGGEALTGDLADALTARAGAVWNLYGPTETTIWSATARVRCDRRVTIGRPIANTSFYVLDRGGQPVIPGLAGELYIGGDGVAAGYLDEPSLTRERFLLGPLGDAIVYRTGDVVRQLHDGRVEYLGRSDNQVKYNGHRIELSEVEHALREHPDVADAVVALRGDADRQSLVGYLLAGDARAALSAGALRRHLGERLPDYMVPAMFIELTRLPLTANGKVDRAALPDPRSSRILTDVPYARPRAGIERAIAGIWRELLGLDSIGVHERFFDLGGDSVVLVQLVERLRAQVADDITHVDVFEFPTIRAMAAHLAEQRGGEASTYVAAPSASDRARALAELRSRRQPRQGSEQTVAFAPPAEGERASAWPVQGEQASVRSAGDGRASAWPAGGGPE
jgi:amino acid adenylation domain-containing protein